MTRFSAPWILVPVGLALVGAAGIARLAATAPGSPGRLVATAAELAWPGPAPGEPRTASTARFTLVNRGG